MAAAADYLRVQLYLRIVWLVCLAWLDSVHAYDDYHKKMDRCVWIYCIAYFHNLEYLEQDIWYFTSAWNCDFVFSLNGMLCVKIHHMRHISYGTVPLGTVNALSGIWNYIIS